MHNVLTIKTYVYLMTTVYVCCCHYHLLIRLLSMGSYSLARVERLTGGVVNLLTEVGEISAVYCFAV